MKNPYLEHGMSKAEKKAYNHKYYEEHKNYWAERGRIKSYRPYYPKSDVADYSDHPGVVTPKSDAIARMRRFVISILSKMTLSSQQLRAKTLLSELLRTPSLIGRMVLEKFSPTLLVARTL